MIFRVSEEAFHDWFEMEYDEWREKYKDDIEELSYKEWKQNYALDSRKKEKERPRWWK